MVNNTRRRNGEAGQSLVLVALGLVVLIGILGLAIDVGYYRYVTRELQTAADAAALAGAMDITYGDQVTAAQAASAENGFTNGANNVAVQVNCYTGCSGQITNSPFVGSGYPTYVQAIVTQSNQPQFFSKILGIHPYTLTASAVAAGGINCIYALDTASGGAISLNIAVVDSTCGVVDNSNISGLLGVLCAPSIQLKGSDNVLIGETCGSGFRNTAPVKITTAVADPLAGVTAPFVLNPPATCTAGTGTNTIAANGVTISPTPIYCGGTVITGKTGITVTQGTYWGSPAFKIQNSTVTFQPGTYNIISRTAGTPGIQMTSTIFNTNKVSFGSGTYTVAGGITDNGAFGSAVNWNNSAGSAALFIIDGGGLKLTGNQSNGTGSIGTSSGGVTFYNTGTAGTGAVTSYGALTSFLDFSAFCGANCQLSAPTTGTYAGILYFEDRSNTATTACGFGGTASACFTADNNYTCNTTNKISNSGAYYFANGTVDFNFDFGCGAPYSLLVAKDINWFFSFTLNNNFANLPNGSPVRQGAAVLVQ
jgi:Flp pilus assembly protein TadG